MNKIGICGLGLIGGSLAKALKAMLPQARIFAADTDREALRIAVRDKIVDGIGIAPPDGNDSYMRIFNGCDILFLCAPPQVVLRQLSHMPERNGIGLVTDVASVKMPVTQAAAHLPNFVGGHPMAGSEGSGYEASDADLFKGATWILCGGGLRASESEARRPPLQSLITAIGAHPIGMDAESHDKRMALISHLPHTAAFALAASPALRDDPLTRSLIGGGFRDTTRIAASSPSLWAEIFNVSGFLPGAIDAYISELRNIRNMIAAGEKSALESYLRFASDFRKTIPEGLHKKTIK